MRQSYRMGSKLSKGFSIWVGCIESDPGQPDEVHGEDYAAAVPGGRGKGINERQRDGVTALGHSLAAVCR